MKIMIITCHTPSLMWFRLDMIQSFLGLGHNVIAVGNEPEEKWCVFFEQFGVQYSSVKTSRNSKNPFEDIKLYFEYKKMYKKYNPQKVFLYNSKSVIYGGIAAKKLKIEYYPLIAGIGSIFISKSFKNRILSKILKIEYKVALSKASCIFFQNNDDIEFFSSFISLDKKKICRINGSGVNLEKFPQKNLPKIISFIFIGRLLRDKGIIEYLSACEIVKQKYPFVNFYLVGPFDSNPSSIKLDYLSNYTNKNVVQYYGEQSDVTPFLERSSVLVLPSYREGTPKVVLEAMAMGRAIITTNEPGCKETIINGEQGFLINSHSISELVDKMEYFIINENLIATFGKKSFERAKNIFDVNIINNIIIKAMKL